MSKPDNPPLNADDELRKALYKLIDDVSVETESYIESKGRLIRRPMEARIKPILDLVATDRKKHELQASYSQLLDAYIGLQNAGRELDLIAQAKRDRVVHAIQDRLLELKQELEKL